MNRGFDVASFIEFSHALELDVIFAAKVIRYYTGDRFEMVMKGAIADQYIDNVRTGSNRTPCNIQLLDKMVRIIKVSVTDCNN